MDGFSLGEVLAGLAPGAAELTLEPEHSVCVALPTGCDRFAEPARDRDSPQRRPMVGSPVDLVGC
ncbi:MAG: hypothetical protein ACRDRS_23065 [Pseudonocardiaceae bacterium]